MSPPINKPVLATITHPKSDHCPILEAGTITPEILYQWRRACQKYLKNCNERTADDLVSFVADEMCEPILEKWYMASQTRIDALKLDAYISELATLVLEKGWEGKMRRQVLGAKMALGQNFADWAYDIQNVNAILSQAAPTFAVANPKLKNILDAGLTQTLQADLDTEPVLSTELNAWISEVKGRDDRLKFETGRMQELIDAQSAKSSRGKPSLADRLSSPKPSLASRLTSPPPKDNKPNCPPLTDAEKVLLDLHDGCRCCRKFYIGHRTLNCNGEFPDAATYHTLTQADAVAQAAAHGKTLQVKREPAAAVRTPKNILDEDYEESDSDCDGY
ncbi:Transposon Ty3-G Gag-Pol polyprotein [Mycena sanguinolenta]|uniref:Transposon Ty3-G Gag-Pol polyprotein n=1 Tax=Mycena sanguinolenta TaxID=230812 RepID=A0A8H6XHS8_9AGAR|nr:Transposon Ty3-G Gag-Pol polyprotein [Mycena sanguinolenta]